MSNPTPIGIFDSGYGGLTVMREIVNLLPQYDYLYLGDNARAPYGTRSFDTVYRYTLQCVNWFFNQGCPLVILACNTASAKALRSIQQKDLTQMEDPTRRVLGVIRPTAEVIGNYTRSGHIGILGTSGTVSSGSYVLEIEKFFPQVRVFQQACPMWVPLIENREYETDGADFFVKKCLDQLLKQSPEIDTILLACTHYPLLINKIRNHVPAGVRVLPQGGIVAESLKDYLHRHPEIESQILKNANRVFYTTDAPDDFNTKATIFFRERVESKHVDLQH